MTNNPDKVHHLRQHGVEVSRRVSFVDMANPQNLAYLEAKTAKLGHWPDSLDSRVDTDQTTRFQTSTTQVPKSPSFGRA